MSGGIQTVKPNKFEGLPPQTIEVLCSGDHLTDSQLSILAVNLADKKNIAARATCYCETPEQAEHSIRYCIEIISRGAATIWIKSITVDQVDQVEFGGFRAVAQPPSWDVSVSIIASRSVYSAALDMPDGSRRVVSFECGV